MEGQMPTCDLKFCFISGIEKSVVFFFFLLGKKIRIIKLF